MLDQTKHRSMGVDVVVRLHDPARLMEFDAALFSLFNQSLAPVRPIVVTQSFNAEATRQVETLISGYDWQERGHQPPGLINVESLGRDVRSQLLNVGIELAQNRFLAFLDGDDYLYGHAYDYLVTESLRSGAAITFGGIVCRHVRVFDQFIYSAKTDRELFRGENLADLQITNFCPIHSFVIDRQQVATNDLTFNPELTRLEDYDFLLRICSKYSAYFESRRTAIGVYNWHLDGRGSISFGKEEVGKAAANKHAWNKARRHIWRLKTSLRSPNTLLPEPSEHLNVTYDSVPADRSSEKIPLLFPLGHFYSPVIDPADILPRKTRLWARSDSVAALDLNPSAQLQLLDELRPYTVTIDYPIADPGDAKTYFYGNDQFPVLDAEFLHAALMYFRPQRMIEIGSGFSSLITARVNRELIHHQLDFTCIEPYPRQFLVDGVDGISRVIQEKVEDVELSLFDRLQSGDVLFIDSSHVSKAGSDVNYLFFEVLPRLKPGVLIHFHDIFLPDEYPQKWVLEEGRNWNEQYLLRAFLQFNSSFAVIWAAHFMGTRHTEAVQAIFPNYPRLGGGGSFWLRRGG